MGMFDAYLTYFENLARNHTSILHSDTEKRFFRMNVSELAGNLKSGIKFPCLVLESFEVRIDANNSDHTAKVITAAFSIIDVVPKVGDYARENEVLDALEPVVCDFIARLWYDSLQQTDGAEFLATLNRDAIEYNKIGPVWNNMFGWRCVFECHDHIDMDVDVSKWGDID